MQVQLKTSVHSLDGTPIHVNGKDTLLGLMMLEVAERSNPTKDPDAKMLLWQIAKTIHVAMADNGIIEMSEDGVWQTFRKWLWQYEPFNVTQTGSVDDLIMKFKANPPSIPTKPTVTPAPVTTPVTP